MSLASTARAVGLAVLCGLAPAVAAPSVELKLHFSERAAFLHWIDTLSRWSPYCSDVDLHFLGVPALGEPDKAWLRRYAAARRPMGYAAETSLFLWAEAGFPQQGRSPGRGELKAVFDHFWTQPSYRDPLAKRMAALEPRRPDLEVEVADLEAQVRMLGPVVTVFLTRAEARRDVPLFVMYTLHPDSSQAGANGGGLYTSVDPFAPTDEALSGTQVLHEYLHLALHPRARVRAFAASDPRTKAWHEALAGVAPDERGEDEASMLDEVLVYALVNVVVEGRDPDRQVENYARRGDKQRVRLWDGVRTLLPIIRRQLEKPAESQEFLSLLIGRFVEKVHYRVWSWPQGLKPLENHAVESPEARAGSA